MTQQLRLDRVALPRHLRPYETEDGMLLVSAVFARDGVLEYRRADGTIRRELRLPEENQKALAQFGLVPFTVEHPLVGLLTKDNAHLYRKGITLQSPKYRAVPGKGGFVEGQIAIFDDDAKRLVQDGSKLELSTGYKCTTEEKPGVYVCPHTGNAYVYDAIQRNIRVNHQAVTVQGRAGADVAIKMDSTAGLEFAYQVGLDNASRDRTASLNIARRKAQLRADGKKRNLARARSQLFVLQQEIAELVEPLAGTVRAVKVQEVTPDQVRAIFAANGRIFSLRIHSKGVSYRPIEGPPKRSKKRVDGFARICDRVDGGIRLDRGAPSPELKKKAGRKLLTCTKTAYNCGKICIGVKRTCHLGGVNVDQQRLRKVRTIAARLGADQDFQQLIGGIRKRQAA